MKKSSSTENKRNSSHLDIGLYVVSTPIGNLEDWTQRAIHVLSTVDVVLAEDTRMAKTLFQKSGITVKKLMTHHEHNEKDSSEGIMKFLEQGQSIALVSDAGTPMINDPGYHLVKKCFERKIKVIPVTGASSLSAALSVCAFGASSVYFGGFLPTQATLRQKILRSAQFKAATIVFFEAPHRIRETLRDAEKIFAPTTEMMICREMTKSFEEILYLPLIEAKNYFEIHEPRGEFVLIFKGAPVENLNRVETTDQAKTLLAAGLSASDILEQLQPVSELTRKEIYDLVNKLKKV